MQHTDPGKPTPQQRKFWNQTLDAVRVKEESSSKEIELQRKRTPSTEMNFMSNL